MQCGCSLHCGYVWDKSRARGVGVGGRTSPENAICGANINDHNLHWFANVMAKSYFVLYETKGTEGRSIYTQEYFSDDMHRRRQFKYFVVPRFFTIRKWEILWLEVISLNRLHILHWIVYHIQFASLRKTSTICGLAGESEPVETWQPEENWWTLSYWTEANPECVPLVIIKPWRQESRFAQRVWFI